MLNRDTRHPQVSWLISFCRSNQAVNTTNPWENSRSPPEAAGECGVAVCTVWGAVNRIDCPPRAFPSMRNPSLPSRSAPH